MQGFLVPYERTENDRYITYSIELWNYLNDGILVIYDKKQKRYTDDFQTHFELSCLGFETEANHLYIDQVKKLVKLKCQNLREEDDTFEIVSESGVEADDSDQIYLNALAQYIILEVFRAKNVLEG